MNTRNIIITGLPRSGTTLVCYLLNELPDIMALHEPMEIKKLTKAASREAMIEAIKSFFARTRRSILERGVAISKNTNGKVPANPYEDRIGDRGLRRGKAPLGEITIEKPLSQDFTLCIKHPAAFTAILPSLVEHFPCFAVIRNPLSVLASWNSVAMPAREGHAPPAERLDKLLAKKLARTENRFERQIRLLGWYFEQYRQFLGDGQIIRYEDVIESKGKSLCIISPKAETLSEALASRNKNKLYDDALMLELGRRLLKTDGAYWHYYRKESVLELI